MSEYLSRYKKRPQSRSEEMERHEQADRNLARRLGEIPRQQTIFELIKHRVGNTVRNLGK